ncbi:DUF6168 family protein [Maribacter arcticus]|uniref:Uncharacterized protein n=1 Tax=Maribacter arcticus TaxID=561365 RepID=A0A1T5BVP0_9FLAO|nr:hypothetical protein SAMN05660866_01854 [Maribacter arcticus]
MLKNILIIIVVFLFVGTTSYFLHPFLLVEEHQFFVPLLKKAYLFHFSFSLILILAFIILARYDKYFVQLGFIYMGLLVFKIVVFAALFYPQLLGENLLSSFYRSSLLIPVIVFLPLEVIFISKIMRGKKAKI